MLRPSPPAPPPAGEEGRTWDKQRKGRKYTKRSLGKHEEKRTFGRHRKRQENYIKVRDRKVIELRVCVQFFWSKMRIGCGYF